MVETYKADPDQIDLILTDFDMPILDGISASIQIREFEKANMLPTKPIAVITSNASEHTRKLATQAGCDMFMIKPLARSDLALSMLKLLSEHIKVLVIDDDNMCRNVTIRML